MKIFFHPIYKILENPYLSILAYPKATKLQIKSRFTEIKRLGIEKVSFFGNTKINSIPIIGKGHNGLVLLAKKNKKLVLKVLKSSAKLINEKP